MNEITITIKGPALAALQRIGGQLVAEALRLGATAALPIVLEAAKAAAPVRSGNLRDSLYTSNINAFGDMASFHLLSDVPYARFVEEGTRAHDIYPRDAGALFWEGAAHPVAMVHHPGTRADPFLERAVAASTPEIKSAVTSAAKRIIESDWSR